MNDTRDPRPPLDGPPDAADPAAATDPRDPARGEALTEARPDPAAPPDPAAVLPVIPAPGQAAAVPDAPAGPEGLAGDKAVIVVSARGNLYGPDTPQAAADSHEPHLRTLFGFIVHPG